jgi:hypothetical protein
MLGSINRFFREENELMGPIFICDGLDDFEITLGKTRNFETGIIHERLNWIRVAPYAAGSKIQGGLSTQIFHQIQVKLIALIGWDRYLRVHQQANRTDINQMADDLERFVIFDRKVIVYIPPLQSSTFGIIWNVHYG